LDHVAVLAVLRIEAVVALACEDRSDDHARLVAGVLDDDPDRLFDGAQDQLDAGFLVGVVALDRADGLLGAQERHATAGDDAFFDRRTGRVQGVFDTRLLFLHLGLGGGTDLDQRHAAGELGHALLELFLVVVAGRFLDLDADLLDARLDVGRGTGAVDDGGVFLAHLDALGLAEVGELNLLERQADFLGDDLAAGQDRDVLEHRLATITEARRLDGDDLQDAADRVHDQRRERFALDFFGNDQQRAARLGDLLQRRQQIADVA